MGCYEEDWTSICGRIEDKFEKDFPLIKNFPNPANPSTVFEFHVPQRGPYRIRIFDLLGRTVRLLEGSGTGEGLYDKVGADLSGLAGGVYLYRFETAAGTGFGKMAVIR
jgi:hypothetical protein